MNEAPGSISAPSRDACKWAMLCHIIALSGFIVVGFGFIVGPLIIWLLKKEDDPFIDEQGKEALNFQITMLIAAAIAGILTLVFIGILLGIAVGILMIVFPIIAAVKANDGVHYQYPLSIRFIK